MRKILLTLLLPGLILTAVYAQPTATPGSEQVVTFRFVPGDDAFYVPWEGNNLQLNALYSIVEQYRTQITSGAIPVYVDSYSASAGSAERNPGLAFTRANRVKSELITNRGLVEDNFITKNYTTAYTDPDGTTHRDIVVVTLRIPVKVEESRPEPRPEPQPQPVAETESEPQPAPAVEPPTEPQPTAEPRYSRWSLGANIGLPFFWGDMTSTAADKTYIGLSAGLQGTYQISPLLGVTLSLDWAQNKAGSRDYARGYLLDAAGMTWYTPQSFPTHEYGELYSKINMFAAGLHIDVNVNRLFGPRIANSRLKLIVSPAVYAQHFSSKVHTRSNDEVYVGQRLSRDISLGLGGDVALRYNVGPSIDLQLKGTGMWITDNLFDNIRTVGYVKQNAMWGISTGVIWKINGAQNTNLLHKKK